MQLKLLLILLLVIFGACYNTYSHDKLEFPLSMQQELRNKIPDENIIVYYHPGDCSFCYGTLKEISEKFPDTHILSLSSSKNKVLVDYYLEQIQFKGFSLIDSSSLFLNKNQKLLFTENLFLIDSQYNILAGAGNYDEKSFKKIWVALHKNQ